MDINKALCKAKELQERNPDWLLCGSLPLMLLGLLPVRDVHDLDFVTSTIPKGLRLLIDDKDSYNLKQSTFEGTEPCTHHVFLNKETSIDDSLHFAGLRIQALSRTLHAKRALGRSKDMADLHRVTNPTDSIKGYYVL